MKKLCQHYFLALFVALLSLPAIIFSSDAVFAELSPKRTDVSALHSYTDFKDLVFTLKEKALAGIGDYEDVLLLEDVKKAISDSDMNDEERNALSEEINAVKQLYPAEFLSIKKRSVRDLRADTIPPQLTSLSISPSVIDVSGGAKDAVFTASATDSGGSGMDSVVIYVSPNMPDGYGFVGIWSWNDTDWLDGQHSRTYTFPQYTAPGVYSIVKVEVEDKAGNTKDYSVSDLTSMGAPTQFTIQGGAADNASPQLTKLEISPIVLDVSAGQTDMTFTAWATDQGGSGVDSVVVYVSPDTPEGYGFVGIWDNISDTGWLDGQHSRTYTFPQYTAPGVYSIVKVEVEDKAGNSKVYSVSDLTSMGVPTQFTIQGGASDTTAPELTKLEINPPAVNISEGFQDMTFSASATDSGGSGVDSVVIYISPDMPEGYGFVGIWSWNDTDWLDGQHSRTYTFPPYSVTGVYTVVKVEVEDKAGNSRTYSQSELSSKGFPVSFQITDSPLTPVLSVSPPLRELSASGGTTSFEVKNAGGGTMSWTASVSDTWLTIVSGSSGVNSGTITVSCAASSENKSAKITVTAAGAGNSPQTVEVRNYTGDKPKYNISGYVSGGVSGTGEAIGIKDVLITFSNGAGSTTTDSSGFYTKSVEYGWSGTVTPSLNNYTFNPSSRSYTNIASNQTDQSYTGEMTAYQISGYVRDSGNSPMSNVTINFDNQGGSTATNDSGYYAKVVSYGWSGTATPSKGGYSFNPPSIFYTSIASNQADRNYTGTSTSVPNIDVSPTSLVFTKPKSSRSANARQDSVQVSDTEQDEEPEEAVYATGLIVPESVEEYWKTHTPSRKYRLRKDLPSSKDWSVYDSPVKNQKICGSCWAFATIALIENLANQANLSVETDFTEQVLVSCLYQDRLEGRGCQGGWYWDGFDYIKKNGIPHESSYPYKSTWLVAWDINCESKKADPDFLVKITNHTPVSGLWGKTNFTVQDLKGALQDGPLCVAMYVPEGFSEYEGGIYDYNSGNVEWGHAVLLLGYDDATQCFKVKNSWGESWGEGGYFRIAYNDVTDSIKFGSYAATASGVVLEKKGNVSQEITITNTGSADLLINTISKDKAWLGIVPQTLSAISPGQSQKVAVSITDWNAVQANETGTIAISSNDPDNSSVPVIVSINMPLQASSPIINISPPFQSGISVTDDKVSIEVSGSDGTTYFTVSNSGDGTMSWTAASNVSWLKIEKGDSGSDTGTVSLSYQANPNTSERTGTITVSASGALNSPQTVEIVQAAAAAPPVVRLPLGDINKDGSVDLRDLILASQVRAGMNKTVRADFIGSDADINKDGKVGAEEEIYILQYLLYISQ